MKNKILLYYKGGGGNKTYIKNLKENINLEYEVSDITYKKRYFSKFFSALRIQTPNINFIPGDYKLIHSHNTLVRNKSKKIYSFECPSTFFYSSAIVQIGKIWKQIKHSNFSTNYSKYIIRKYLYDSDFILPWTETAKESAVEELGISRNRLQVLYAPIKPVEVKKIKHKNIRILFIGKRFEKKGGPELLDVFQELEKKYDVELWINTDENYYNLLKSRVINYRIIPYMTLEELYNKVYNNVDIFCMPTLGDSYGYVYLEAMNSELPIVATNYPVVQEIVENNKNGFLVDCGKPMKRKINKNELYEKLKILIEDSRIRKDFGRNSKKIINNKFSTDVIIPKLEKIYQEVLK